eukprot:scaffold101009_cov63-Phaeocystis_antarctica.AAC.1
MTVAASRAAPSTHCAPPSSTRPPLPPRPGYPLPPCPLKPPKPLPSRKSTVLPVRGPCAAPSARAAEAAVRTTATCIGAWTRSEAAAVGGRGQRRTEALDGAREAVVRGGDLGALVASEAAAVVAAAAQAGSVQREESASRLRGECRRDAAQPQLWVAEEGQAAICVVLAVERHLRGYLANP